LAFRNGLMPSIKKRPAQIAAAINRGITILLILPHINF